jgi:probable HAF family extracellular repeat protein
MKDLGTFGGEFSFAYALNSYDIVGTAETKTRERHAFLYRDGKLKDLNSLIPPKSGWTLIEATAISEGGKILCMARKSDGLIYAVLLTQQGAAGPKAPSR